MKKKKLILSVLAIPSLMPVAVAAACGNNTDKKPEKVEQPPQSETPKPQQPAQPSRSEDSRVQEVKKTNLTKEISLLGNSTENYTNFVNQLLSVPNLGQEYSKVKLAINLASLNLTKTFSRDDFISNVLPVLGKNDNSELNYEDDESEEIQVLAPTNRAELDETAKFLKNEFNNYRVLETWFVNKLGGLVNKAETKKVLKTGKISKQQAQSNNKLTEYNAVVNEVKEFLKTNALIQFADNVEIIEFDYTKTPAWSLKIKLKVNNLETDFIKLDFQKSRDRNATEESLRQENKNRSSLKEKIKNVLLNSTVLSVFANRIKVYKLALVIDESKQISKKLTDLMSPYVSESIIKRIPFIPDFILRKFVSKIVSKILAKIIASVQTKVQDKFKN
ncbi:hypothetical protein EG856_02240 [Mycoplasmopsis phocirhinis]|uniref:Variable surface lipoprotein n=1 Tax=Mycoplasmopsis phocirhinis TaxID=142650 RepID=A0A4P6MTN0_9BACT|nr:hypothetical protein [Mycoplasmopsis phocirhinis]QBF34727.1 hypothetical protein EG856_02240 [Mycoplasmopsis phocirhinis]